MVCGQRQELVTVQVNTPTETDFGQTPNWTTLDTYFCSVVVKDVNTVRKQEEGRSYAEYQVVFRGQQVFDFALYRFLWAGLVLQPQQARRVPGRAKSFFTYYICEDITDRADPDQTAF